ncbi:hypothetical protein Ocin01_14484 [Orchesella cincta]|uniref:Uncharacterized protein n=1 Tax=Orchesella cincta TaxID=48709 RepID=A0A1D2MGS2_ORCCI|nr:hypothetical protein Ocin01_14484 [Orchesella cincta]
MSFGKSKVERFPSYSISTAPAASVSKKEDTMIPSRMNLSLCGFPTSSSSPTTGSPRTPSNSYRGGVSKQFSSLDKKRRVGYLSNSRFNRSRLELSKARSPSDHNLEQCEAKNKRTPTYKAMSKRTPTPKGKLLKAAQARAILAFAKAADADRNSKVKAWIEKHQMHVIPSEVFSTPPTSPSKDSTALNDDVETKCVNEALPENRDENQDKETTVTEVTVTVLEVHHHSPKIADTKSTGIPDSVPGPNPIVDLPITAPESETVTTSGRKPRLRRNSRSAPSSPIIPSDNTQRHIPTPMPRRNNHDEDLLPRRNSSPTGILTSGWDANYNYMHDSALQRSLIGNSSNSSFAPIASSGIDPLSPSFSQTRTPTRDTTTVLRTSVGEEINGPMRQEVVQAFQVLRELNISFRTARSNRIGTPQERGPEPRAENLTQTSPQTENRDIRCNEFGRAPWCRRAFGMIFGKKIQRPNKTVEHSSSGLNCFSCDGSDGRDSVNERENSESRTLLQRWVLDNFLHRDYIRLWRHMRLDGRRTVRRMRLVGGPATTDFIKDPQFWMPALEFVLGQLLELTLRW